MFDFIARGALGSFGLKVGIVGLGFLNQMVITRLMGAEQFGIYIYALTWLGVLGQISRLGMEGMLTRYTASYRAEAKWGLLRGLVRFGFQTVLFSSLAVVSLSFIFLEWLGPLVGKDSILSLRFALILLPLYSLIGISQSLLYGLKLPWHGQLPEILLRVFMLPLAGLSYWYWQSLSAIQGVLCGLIAAILVLYISLKWVHQKLPREIFTHRQQSLQKIWMTTALPILSISFQRTLLTQCDILLIGMIIPSVEAVGLYAVAMRLAEISSFGLQAVTLNLAPVIAELHITGQRDKLQGLLTYSAYGIFSFTLATTLGLYFFGESILKLFGNGFTAAYRPMMILMVGQVINSLTGSVGCLMTMTGHQSVAARIVTANFLITIALNLTFIPQFGLEGAALASATGLVLVNLANLSFVMRTLHLNPTMFRRAQGSN